MPRGALSRRTPQRKPTTEVALKGPSSKSVKFTVTLAFYLKCSRSLPELALITMTSMDLFIALCLVAGGPSLEDVLWWHYSRLKGERPFGIGHLESAHCVEGWRSSSRVGPTMTYALV